MGTFSAIYHPVGIPMLVQRAKNPGATIGVNGLAGNLGIAAAAIVTGFLVKWIGAGARRSWCRALVAIACGLLFMRAAPHESERRQRLAQGRH
ncbi:MAG: hypothetical protein U1F25_18690 [Rubrivivax sp.]